MSSLFYEKTCIYYSPKHIYWLVKNNLLIEVKKMHFPSLKYGYYQKREKPATKRLITTSINERSKIINERTRYGDVEIDTVEGTKLDNHYLSTAVNRKSRRLSICLYQTKSSQSFLEAVKTNKKKMLTKVNSITSDNGTENALLDELKIPWFATNAYSSWQKGTIEQKHKQIRKFIPKGKSFSKLNQELCDLIALIINAETFLQSPHKYKLGKIVTKDELEKYYELLTQKEPHLVFRMW